MSERQSTFKISPLITVTVLPRGITLSHVDLGPLFSIGYPAAAVWDLAGRSYPLHKIARQLTYIAGVDITRSQAFVERVIREWVECDALQLRLPEIDTDDSESEIAPVTVTAHGELPVLDAGFQPSPAVGMGRGGTDVDPTPTTSSASLVNSLTNRWSIPYIDQPAEFWNDLQQQYGNRISDVYFPMPGGTLGSGRPRLPDAHESSFLGDTDLPKSVLLNAVTLPRPVAEIAPSVVEGLRRLIDEYGIVSATVADLLLAQRIREALPDFPLTASILMEIDEPVQAMMLNGICDTLVPASRIVRDLPALRAIRDGFPGRLRLLVNEACVPGCPHRRQHFHEMATGFAAPKSLCSEMLHEQPWLRLIGSWILPQHLHFFDGVFDELKLAGRATLQDPEQYRRVLGAYIDRRPLSPHEIGGGPSSVLEPIEINDEFYEFTLNCGRQCHQCDRCPVYYDQAMNSPSVRSWANRNRATESDSLVQLENPW